MKQVKHEIVVETKRDTKIYSYDEAVALTGHGRYNHLCLVACSIISNAVACDMFGFGVVVAAATCDLQLGLKETAILASAPFAGLVFTFPWGYFADTRGRRRALLISTGGGFIFSSLSSLSHSWHFLLALKLIGSCFTLSSFTLTMTYLGENVDDIHRSRYLLIMNCVNIASEMVSFGLAYFVLPLSFSVSVPWLYILYRPWRLYSFLLTVPLGIGACMLFFLHESPSFLASKGDYDQALQVLKSIYTINNGKEKIYAVTAFKTRPGDECTMPVSFWKSIVKQTVPIFRYPLVLRTLQLFYFFIICCSTNNVFLMWFPKMVNSFFTAQSGSLYNEISFCRNLHNMTASTKDDTCNDTISNNALYSGVSLGVSHMALIMLAIRFATWRRVILISTFVVSAVSSVLVVILRQPIAIISAFILLQGTSVSLGVIASYFVDFYPTSYRGLATCLGLMSARLASICGVNIVGSVIIDYCDATFYTWSIFVISGAVVALFLPSQQKIKENNK